MSLAGNTTMTHLFLGLDPKYIREEPYIPTVSAPPRASAAELGLRVNPHASIYCMPSVGSYVGGDITSGVLSSGLFLTDKLTLFIDVGTNGEIVLGNKDWLISCACSAGPAFEGGGVRNGMRATAGAIEDVWIHRQTYDATFRTISNRPALGICGSGLIDLLGEMFITGIIDKSGHINRMLPTPRVRQGDHGPEYVVAWAPETGLGRRHRPQRGRHQQPAARQGRHLRRLFGALPQRGRQPGRRGADSHRRGLWPVHQRGKGHPDRPDARPAVGPVPATWGTPARWAPTRPCCARTCAARSWRSPAR